MDGIRQEIAAGFEKLLAENCPSERVHAIEAGAEHQSLWATFEASGFVDALVPAAAGGIGLDLDDASPIAEAAGRFAVPVPLAETMVIRGALALSANNLPPGSIAFGGNARLEDGDYICRAVVDGARTDNILVCLDGQWKWIATRFGSIVEDGLEATLRFDPEALASQAALTVVCDPVILEAVTRSLQISGALAAILDRSLAYANDREQFGRPIGKFQAIQHQLSIVAEQAFSGQMAASLAGSGELGSLDPLRIAIGKARTSEAAVEAAALAHSIHGAIGFTREFDLQLFTRRLNAWRRAGGSEGYWQRRAGCSLLSENVTALDVLRRATEKKTD